MRTTGGLVDEGFPHRSLVDACFVSCDKFFNFIQVEIKLCCIFHSYNPLFLVLSDYKYAIVQMPRFNEVCDFREEYLNHIARKPNSKLIFLCQQKFV